VIERQHVWVGPETTTFACSCEVCLSRRGSWGDLYGGPPGVDAARVEGTLRRDADVGFTTCRRGHRIVVRRVGRGFAHAV
jgi:hypothetical protein